MADLAVHRDYGTYKLPEEFVGTKLSYMFQNDFTLAECCRLSSYEVLKGRHLNIRLSKTTYEDYLVSSEHLDDFIPTEPSKTFRNEFGKIFEEQRKNLRPFNLTNICGVGVFIISSDNYIIATTHAESSHVYPGRDTFSASGTLRWGACPNPFQWVMHKCLTEINHQIDLNKLKLISFGADARKLYFQFSFIEESEDTATQIISRCDPNINILEIPLELEPVIRTLMKDCWEPAAEVTLLSLCIRKFGRDALVQCLASNPLELNNRNMIEEWDFRASCHGALPDMTIRYPRDIREREI